MRPTCNDEAPRVLRDYGFDAYLRASFRAEELPGGLEVFATARTDGTRLGLVHNRPAPSAPLMVRAYRAHCQERKSPQTDFQYDGAPKATASPSAAPCGSGEVVLKMCSVLDLLCS